MGALALRSQALGIALRCWPSPAIQARPCCARQGWGLRTPPSSCGATEQHQTAVAGCCACPPLGLLPYVSRAALLERVFAWLSMVLGGCTHSSRCMRSCPKCNIVAPNHVGGAGLPAQAVPRSQCKLGTAGSQKLSAQLACHTTQCCAFSCLHDQLPDQAPRSTQCQNLRLSKRSCFRYRYAMPAH